MNDGLKSAIAFLSAQDADVAIAVGIGFILFGVPLAMVRAGGLMSWSRSRQWSQTTGSIINVVIEDVTHRDGFRTADDYDSYMAHVSYQYTVAGKEYVGKRRRIVDDATSYSEAEAVFNRYSAGDSVPVWYNPDDPGEAVLDRSVSLTYFVGGIVGIAFSTLGVSTVYLAIV